MRKSSPKAQKSFTNAISALRKGAPEETIAICNSHLLESPASVPHLQLLAHALIKIDKLNDALEHIRFAIKLAPEFAPLYEDLGSVKALGDDFDGAIDAFRRAIARDPRLPGAHKKLTQALISTGRNHEIDEAFEGYLDHDSDAAFVAAGIEHWRSGRLEEAKRTLKRALRENHDNVDAMRFLAKIYYEQNSNLDDAEALLRRATNIAQDFHQAFSNLGRILIDSGKWDDAVDCYQHLVELQPQDDTAWSGLGRAYNHAGQVKQSLSAYEKSLRIKGDSASVNLAYAHVLKTAGRQEEALSSYRNSIRL